MKKKRPVFLVNIGNPTKWISIPFGLAFIGKALNYNKIPFEVIDLLPIEIDKREQYFRDFVRQVDAGIFGFSLIIGNNNLSVTIKYINIIKEESKNHIVVLGGPLPTAIPQILFENTSVDFIVPGEGEERFVSLVNYMGS